VSHLDPTARPEPPVDCRGLEVVPVAALEVAEPAAGPNVGQVVLLEEIFDHLILSGCLERHQVHAVLAANVSSVQPVHLVVSEVFFVS